MSNLTILPADTYTVINKTIINDNELKIVSMLYQPIIGYTATALYMTLINDLDKLQVMSEDFTHHHLMATMQLKLDDIVIAREKLEAVGLLKTYLKKEEVNHYAYLIYAPLSANDFFTHPILNIVLYNNVGRKEYNKLINMFRLPKVSLKDYEDITLSFNEVFDPVRGSILDLEDDLTKRTTGDIVLKDSIDFNLLISGIPESNINRNCFNDEIKELINALNYTYNLGTIVMQGLVRDSINEKGLIDKTKLRKSCRDYYQFENNGQLPTLIYSKSQAKEKKNNKDLSKWDKLVYAFEHLTPYQFLKIKYKGAEPTSRDKKLIESLLVEQKFNYGVVNVLIAYVLKLNNEQLKKSYVETIAGQWKRLNIKTVEEAMKITEQEHNKTEKLIKKEVEVISKKTPVKENPSSTELPVWFNKNLDKEELSKEDQDELDKLLDELA